MKAKFATYLFLLCLPLQGLAQAKPDPETSLKLLVNSTKPKAMVVVQKHAATDADLVEITMLNPKYPPELLRQQCLYLAQMAGADARGLYVYNTNPSGGSSGFLKAKFGTNNLIDIQSGVLRLQPIVKAFAGMTNEFAVDALMISFQGLKPGSRTLRAHATKAVALRGETVAFPAGIEYRVRILTTDPEQIAIPETSTPPVAPAKEGGKAEQKGLPIAFWVAIGLGSLAAGYLVYSLALTTGKK